VRSSMLQLPKWSNLSNRLQFVQAANVCVGLFVMIRLSKGVLIITYCVVARRSFALARLAIILRYNNVLRKERFVNAMKTLSMVGVTLLLTDTIDYTIAFTFTYHETCISVEMYCTCQVVIFSFVVTIT